MPKPKHKLVPTEELIKVICERIMAGAFDHVAVECEGIPYPTFQQWLAWAEKPNTKRIYKTLRDEVRKAKAHARFMAEMAMRTDDPKAWLMHGPGKEGQGLPGWSAPVKPIINQDNRQVNVLLSPELMGVFAAILQILAPLPEARAAVAEALASMKKVEQIKDKVH